MTKSQRAELWFKNGLERRKYKQLEDHVSTISKWIFLSALVVIWLINYIQGLR